ncbi:MAG: hypothetical protein JRH11_06300 [Deltaproteobacteria bacterium]|nr:hypothetical protein [Deltaproteobacteria bacterium]
MRGLSIIATCGVALWGVACAADVDGGPPVEPADPVEAARAYMDDASLRRAALEESAAVADTAYARLRLDHYSLTGMGVDDPAADWDLLPLRVDRPVRRLRVGPTADDPVPTPFAPEPIFGTGRGPENLDDYVAAGKQAFELCPLEVDPRFGRLRRGADVARSYGLTVTDEGEVRGAVEVRADDGSWVVALSCAACHSSADDDGAYAPGLSNPEFELAELLGAAPFPTGTMDVSPDRLWNPVRPPDLRPLRYQERLHHTGNLTNGRVARMVRIETLITSRLNFRFRPDRRVVASMALYLESLADALPPPAWDGEGGTAFRSACAGCHQGDAMAGPPVDVDVVGTDPAATVGSSRGTGAYRAPSLLGVTERRRILHDGSALTIEALLGLDGSEHRGHRYGTDLPRATRQAIVDFLGR